jgi:hypothetical protein
MHRCSFFDQRFIVTVEAHKRSLLPATSVNTAGRFLSPPGVAWRTLGAHITGDLFRLSHHLEREQLIIVSAHLFLSRSVTTANVNAQVFTVREDLCIVDATHELPGAVPKEANCYDNALFSHADGSADLDGQDL